jgi:hypothetical protein
VRALSLSPFSNLDLFLQKGKSGSKDCSTAISSFELFSLPRQIRNRLRSPQISRLLDTNLCTEKQAHAVLSGRLMFFSGGYFAGQRCFRTSCSRTATVFWRRERQSKGDCRVLFAASNGHVETSAGVRQRSVTFKSASGRDVEGCRGYLRSEGADGC